MDTSIRMFDFIPLPDLLALLVFVGGWFGYATYADIKAIGHRPITVVMNDYRLRWFERMLERDNRMPDVNIAVALERSCMMFASTTILLLAGSLAMLGQVDAVYDLIATLKYTRAPTQGLLELQIITLTFVFVYAFFKFIWAIRLFNNMLILLGAAPQASDCDDVVRREYPGHMARFCSRAFYNMNKGVRAFAFGLALLPWLLHPALLAISTAVVIAVSYRRDFRSVSLRVLEDMTQHH